jgi:hypothetical protein
MDTSIEQVVRQFKHDLSRQAPGCGFLVATSGYGFFSIDQADATVFGKINGFTIGSATLPQHFTASELLFGLRIYEPFRRWR